MIYADSNVLLYQTLQGSDKPILGDNFDDPFPRVLETVLGEGEPSSCKPELEKVCWEENWQKRTF
jgi:hypothetical protein